jgi:acyl-CoA synthetase (AMP-forming)/AMP-acid ligase II
MHNVSIIDPLLENIRRFPHRPAYILIQDDNQEEAVTFAQLHRHMISAAGALRASGVGKGDIVILALRHSHLLIAAFWGAQYIGAIPSIFPYPAPMQNHDTYGEKLSALIGNAGAKALVVAQGWEKHMDISAAGDSCRIISDNTLIHSDTQPEACLSADPATGEEIAYIQYTSGSTGLQKGVLLSHRAILNFTSSFSKGIAFQDGDIVANWLPLYHDFGLFAGFVVPLLRSYLTILMSPFKWIRNPKLLLDIITRHKATMCWMPNFGFNHTVRCMSPSRKKGVDLNSLRRLGSGGEPIKYNSLEIFSRHFEANGFRQSSMTAGYGMAENTLTVSISQPDRMPRIDWVDSRILSRSHRAVPVTPETTGAIPVVSCGVPVPGVEIKIVDSDGNPLEPRQKGQIVIRSDSLFSGYHKRPDLTAKVLRGEWYQTGDMGYMADGELYITGRKKDLIILGGENIHPEDLEAIAGTIPRIQPDRCVAFGVYDSVQGTERAVLICNVERSVKEGDKPGIERAIRKKVTAEIGITLGDVHLVSNGWIVKTQNGKIARQANRKKYLEELVDKKS